MAKGKREKSCFCLRNVMRQTIELRLKDAIFWFCSRNKSAWMSLLILMYRILDDLAVICLHPVICRHCRRLRRSKCERTTNNTQCNFMRYLINWCLDYTQCTAYCVRMKCINFVRGFVVCMRLHHWQNRIRAREMKINSSAHALKMSVWTNTLPQQNKTKQRKPKQSINQFRYMHTADCAAHNMRCCWA